MRRIGLHFVPGLVPLLLAQVLGTPLALADIPAWSRDRAEQLDRWRSAIAEAQVEIDRGRPDRGEELYRSVVEEAGDDAGRNLLLARAVDGLADLCRTQERFDEAARLYSRSAAMWEELLGPGQPRLATTLHNLGLVYLAQGNPHDAERSLSRALAIWESSLGPDSPEARNTRRALASLSRSGTTHGPH